MGTWWMPACGKPPASSGAPRGHLSDRRGAFERNPGRGGMRKSLKSWAFVVEPPWGIEPQTYALREARQAALDALPAQIAALASRNALCAQSARIPGPRPGPRPSHLSSNRLLLAGRTASSSCIRARVADGFCLRNSTDSAVTGWMVVFPGGPCQGGCEDIGPCRRRPPAPTIGARPPQRAGVMARGDDGCRCWQSGRVAP
jgi:hypothetical protein